MHYCDTHGSLNREKKRSSEIVAFLYVFTQEEDVCTDAPSRRSNYFIVKYISTYCNTPTDNSVSVCVNPSADRAEIFSGVALILFRRFDTKEVYTYTSNNMN